MVKYKHIYKHYEKCFEEHGDTPQGVDWPDEDGAQARYQVMLDGVNLQDDMPTVLDFGCGLSHFYEFLQNKSAADRVVYSGIDISQKFVTASWEKYPGNVYHCVDIMQNDNHNLPIYDYVIANGVFTEKLDMTHDEMMSWAGTMIKKMWRITSKRLIVNFMSKQVDWERDDLFHVSLDEIAQFVISNLGTRDFIIRNDYGLYEYTIYISKRGAMWPTE